MREDRLKNMRETRGLSQADLASRVGVNAQQIYRIENGKSLNPGTDLIIAIARELDVSSDYLLGLTNNPHGQKGEDDLTNEERDILSAFRRQDVAKMLKMVTGWVEKDN